MDFGPSHAQILEQIRIGGKTAAGADPAFARRRSGRLWREALPGHDLMPEAIAPLEGRMVDLLHPGIDANGDLRRPGLLGDRLEGGDADDRQPSREREALRE